MKTICKNLKKQKHSMMIGLTIAMLLGAANSHAQSWQWGNSGGASDDLGDPFDREKVVSMCTAANGDTYVTSIVGRQNLVIGGYPKQTYSSNGLNDLVIAGFSCQGNYKWSKVIGSYYGATNAHLAVDAQGNVYAGVRLDPTAPNVSPAPHFDSDITLGSSSYSVNTYKQSIFLIKYDSNGNYQWLRKPQADDVNFNTGNNVLSFGLDVDDMGNSYWMCLLSASTYGNGQYVVSTRGIHILKYDKDGNFLGGYPLDMTIDTAPYAFKMVRDHNNGRIYLGGEYDVNVTSSNLRFAGQPVTHSKFLAAFDSNGTLVWEKENNITGIPGNGGISYGVTVDSDSNVYFIGATRYVTGNEAIPDSFNGIPFVNYGIPPWPFIVKLDPAGNTLWQTNGANSSLVAVAVNGDEVGVSYGANHLLWQGIAYEMPSTYQPYVARFNKSDGTIININRMVTSGNDGSTALTVDAHGNYYMGGGFQGTITTASNTVSNHGGQSDFYVAKFGTNNCDLATQSFQEDDGQVYPNPVHDKLYFSKAAGQNFTLCNSLGQQVMSGTFTQGSSINVEQLSNGVYLLQLQTGKEVVIKKIVKY